MLSCSSSLYVSFSHLLNDSDLLHKQTGSFSGESQPFGAGHRKILTRGTASDDVHRRKLPPFELCNIAHMNHVGKMQLCYSHGKGFDLAGPEGFDPKLRCRQREAADPIEQAAHGQFIVFLIRYAPPA